MADSKNLEDMLMKHLLHPHIDKTVLKKYSAHLASAKAANFKFERIWWIGIPWPEWLYVQTSIPIESIADIQKLISPEINSLEIFPLGIPVPIELQTIVKLPLINPVAGEGGINR
jgi:hypothetical protein